MSPIYNDELKENFLSKFSDETKVTYLHVFKKSYELEDLICDDLYSFKINQIEALLKKFEFKTAKAAKTYLSIISSYVNWAIEQGLRNESNPLKERNDDWISKFVIQKKTLFTEEEIIFVEDRLVNYQDKVIPRLLFEGVNLHELLNLRVDDVNGNSLLLRDEDEETRKLNVSNRAIDFIIRASNEKEYRLKNGESTAKRTVSELVSNHYVIKSSIGKSLLNYKQANQHLIYRRLATVGELFSGYKYFNVGNISRSGKLKVAKDFYLKNGELTDEHYISIQNQFGFKSKIQNNALFYSLSSIKEYVNIENIKDLYDV